MYSSKREEDFEGDPLRKKLFLDVKAALSSARRRPEGQRLYTSLDGELTLTETVGEDGDIKVGKKYISM